MIYWTEWIVGGRSMTSIPGGTVMSSHSVRMRMARSQWSHLKTPNNLNGLRKPSTTDSTSVYQQSCSSNLTRVRGGTAGDTYRSQHFGINVAPQGKTRSQVARREEAAGGTIAVAYVVHWHQAICNLNQNKWRGDQTVCVPDTRHTTTH